MFDFSGKKGQRELKIRGETECPGRPRFNPIIPKSQKMALDASLLYTQHYKV